MALPTVVVTPGVGQTINTLANAGQTTMASSHPVTLASDQSVLSVGGYTTIASSNFNRPADTTAYAVGDLVANSTTAGSVTPMSITLARINNGTGKITRAKLKKSSTTLTLGTFRAHMYTVSPTPSNGDNAAWLTDQSGSYLGYIDFDFTGPIAKVFTDGAATFGAPIAGSASYQAGAASQIVYCLMEARAAYVPTSGETFTLTLESDGN